MFHFTRALPRRMWQQSNQQLIKEAKCCQQVQHYIAAAGAETETRTEPLIAAANFALRYLVLASALIMLMSLALPRAAHAQVLYGSLTGNVTDPAGAAVPGATISALNVGTNVAKETTTNEDGVYQFSDLLPGIYKVTISAPNFGTVAQEGVNVEANTVRRVDASLKVSQLSEVVTVNAEDVPALQVDRADVNLTQPARQVNNLPLAGSAGRNYQSLMQIVPGAVLAGEQNSAAGSPQRSISFNVNGVSRLQNNTKIDGSSITYPWLPTNTAYVPPAEAIQAVNIVTNAFDAEQGLAGGAAVNVILKTGTNEFHGVGWGYHTNSRFSARNHFQTSPQNPKDLLTQYGYAIGGPIYFPHFGEGGPRVWSGKNKLFFFTDFERTTRRNLSRDNRVSLAPASLRPDASGNVHFPTAAEGGATIYDPASNPNPALRTPFPNNTVPANRIDLAAIELIKRLPQPNAPGFVNNFLTNGVASFNRNNIDTKINYNHSERLTLFGRYSYSPTLITEPPILGEAGGDAVNGGQLGAAPGLVQVAGMGGTYTFGPTLVLDANFGYTRQKLGAQGPDVVSGINFGLDVLKIPGTNGPDPLQAGIPFFNVSNWANMGNSNTGNPFLFRDNQFVGSANISWLRGAHSFRFGGDFQDQQLNHFQPQGGTFQTPRGTFQFSGNITALQGGASANRFNSWADFLLGLPSGAGKVDQLRNPNSLRMKSYALYARDHWQINRKLTLSYGLRWELYAFPTKDNTGINRFDPDTGRVLTGGLSGVPEDTGAHSGSGQFLPRVGVAYRLNEKTVLRGGYGQSADPRPFIDFRNAYPVIVLLAMPTPTFNGATNSFLPVTTLRQGLVNPNPPPDLSQGVLPLPSNTGTTTYPADPRRKEIHSFNVIVERQLPWNFTSSIGYVGTRAVGQMGFININASAPGTGNNGRPLFTTDAAGNRVRITADINEIIPYRTTTYDSLQATLNRRWASSIFGVAYTWSKAINYADNDANPRIQYMPEARRNRGPAGYDRPHNLQTYLVYDLPFGKGQHWADSGVGSKLLGGFQFNGIMSIMSGTPFYVVQNTAPNLNAGGSGQVPNQLNPVIQYRNGIGLGNPYFDNTILGVNCTSGCAWAPETGARFGSAGRNNLRGPGFFNVDLGLFRTFSLSEDFKLQLRAEALNALNHPNFANPNANISDPSTFGFITATTGTAQRVMRFAARLSF
ncbi:MAG: TonB-dependent receptor domain-containing protein [Pyrinomonadaceae bacterium]